jgi:hypothetical protein
MTPPLLARRAFLIGSAAVPVAAAAPSYGGSSPLRAWSLSPGQFLLSAPKKNADIGGMPVRAMANFPGSVAMRIENTPRALALADWRPYAAESLHFIPTGGFAREVFAEFKDPAGNVTSTSALVPANTEDDLTRFDLPITAAIFGYPDCRWKQDFSRGVDRWATYAYNEGGYPGDNGGPGVGNIWQPCSWSESGGPNGAPFIWTDDSRYWIDYPETPDVVFMFCIRVRWPMFGFSGPTKVDFASTTMRFWLRQWDADFKGAAAHVYLNADSFTDTGFYHHRGPGGTALQFGDGEWAENVVTIDAGSEWRKGWPEPLDANTTPDTTQVYGFGISFTLAGEKPVGRFGMAGLTVQETT